MKKIILITSVSVAILCADVLDSAYSCTSGKGCLKKYSSLLEEQCAKDDKKACATLAKNYYKNGNKSGGDYYACWSGNFEACQDKDTQDLQAQDYSTNSNDESQGATQPKTKTCSEEEKMIGCVEIEHNVLGGIIETPYKDGKVNGVRKSYYENGNLSAELTYKDGEMHGIMKSYYKNGNLELEVPYKNDEKDGVEKSYYESGVLDYEIPYKDNEFHGTVKNYYENGNLEVEMSYKDGRIHGAVKSYYKNGNLRYESMYKEGETDGIEKGYYENGKLAYETTYKNGKLNGVLKFYSANGALLWQASAQNHTLMNGKCLNGKVLTNAHLASVLKDINANTFDLPEWNAICNK